jgi:lipocalin
MPKYKVTATKDVGYAAIIEAPTKDEAWVIARGDNPDAEEPNWEQADDGHDWTLENIWEVEE